MARWRQHWKVQRTIKRAELAALPVQKSDWPTTKELLTGYGQEKEDASTRKLVMPACASRFGKNCTFWSRKKSPWKLEHVKAHRTKKDKNHVSHKETFVTEGNKMADELANVGAMLDEGFMAELRAKTVSSTRERERRRVRSLAACHCLVEEWKDCEELKPKPKEKWMFVDKKREEMKHQTEWCAQANKYRCTRRCGRSSGYMEMPGKCTEPKYLSNFVWKMGAEVLGKP